MNVDFPEPGLPITQNRPSSSASSQVLKFIWTSCEKLRLSLEKGPIKRALLSLSQGVPSIRHSIVAEAFENRFQGSFI
jgi:hypothetical protein